MTENNTEAIFSLVYRMLQTKHAHVQYSTTKAIRFYRAMVEATDNNRTVIGNATRTLNRVWALRQRISRKTEQLAGREKRYGKKVVSLLDDIITETESLDRQVLHYTGVMKGATDSLLMTILKAAHYQWRERVYLSVISRSNTLPTDDDGSCILGWWYHHSGRERFGSIPAFIRLGEVHHRLHQVTAELGKEDLRVQELSGVVKKLEAFEAVSQSVIAALDELDEYLIRLNGWSETGTPGDTAASPVETQAPPGKIRHGARRNGK
ncbi:TPA: hypothetical protein I8Y21_002289 [Klebsiella oxytoca]|uniref:Chemoreceptor zinc-binding domain-containing protein n=1 Tax=Klebsiella oxytoca TaxID=571 RepID=A0AAN5L7C0_KLEOX|nr:hypothetical protein [Klebsiella oxytoca]